MIVQGDRIVLLEVHSPGYESARDALSRFAELIKSPEHVHTYRITPLSIWNAVAAGVSAEEACATLEFYAKYDIPQHILTEIREYAGRFGRLKIETTEVAGLLSLCAKDEYLAEEISRRKEIAPLLEGRVTSVDFHFRAANRGKLKQELVKAGWPAEDLAGYVKGEGLEFALREVTQGRQAFGLRNYQRFAAEAFHASGDVRGGNGVIVMPCGAGKTIIGMGVMEKVCASTLIITTSVTAARQWIEELSDKTTLSDEQIGEYSGHLKDVKPVTVTTYQILTYRRSKNEDFKHFSLFNQRDWGLIIYDEVHTLPAPVFSVTAEIQARRRLGLTATLVREDGREDDVFALIGPKKADVPWKVLEKSGWIAPALCCEVRLALPESHRMNYALADKRVQFRIASENPDKLSLLPKILERHPGEPTLVIGQYLDQLKAVAEMLDAPIITGKIKQVDRDRLYEEFKQGKLSVLVVSKVANFALDLPDARVAIQISGTFGSRQEEAQRLGRILRPKIDGGPAYFYTLVSRDTSEMEFAQNRQLFLTEQGYSYKIIDAAALGSEV